MQTNNVFRTRFPYFSSKDNPIYLDTAATSQKLQSVIDREYMFVTSQYASVHRAMYSTATEATQEYENVRLDIARWLNAIDHDVVFTSGATHALNIVANGIQPVQLKGTKILICESEHHANILPWQALAKKYSLQIEVLRLKPNGIFDEDCLEQWLSTIDDTCALIACAHVSNVFGNIYPVDLLCKKAKQVNAISIIDGTQAVAHKKVDLSQIDCDCYVFSGHKMYASTGVGALVGKQVFMSTLAPYSVGGEMVASASFTSYTAQSSPLKFEAGTPNITAVLGMASAIDFLRENVDEIDVMKNRCFAYLDELLSQNRNIRLLGNPHNNIGIRSFYFREIDNHQIALQLWERGIALRYGQHCAMPLFENLGITACLRVSLGCYTTLDDIESFAKTLADVVKSSEIDTTSNGPKRLSNKNDANAIIEKIKLANDWASKNRLLMHLSAFLSLLPELERSSENKFNGCESQVWIDKSQHNSWRAYSDSKTVRGLLAFILLKLPDAKTKKSMQDVLFDYGLDKYFSVGRKSGVAKIIEFLYDNV